MKSEFRNGVSIVSTGLKFNVGTGLPMSADGTVLRGSGFKRRRRNTPHKSKNIASGIKTPRRITGLVHAKLVRFAQVGPCLAYFAIRYGQSCSPI